jgi:hypothetical protein
MNIKLRKAADLKQNESNPRYITEENYNKLKKSLTDFPEMLRLRPLVVDDNDVVLGGNMRLRAIKELGIEQVPVLHAGDLTEEQKQQFVIKDNLPFGYWDWDVLANEWDVADLTEWGLDVPVFNEEEEEVDVSDLEESMETYLNNTIRQIVLYYEAELHTNIIDRMKAIEEDFGISEDNSTLFLKLLEHYENSRD